MPSSFRNRNDVRAFFACRSERLAFSPLHGSHSGGIAAVDAEHRSRLRTAHEAFYYLVTLLLQLVPYSLASAAGVNIGIAAFAGRERTGDPGPRMPHLRIPYAAIRDAGWIWAVSLPLFALASLFEFTMP